MLSRKQIKAYEENIKIGEAQLQEMSKVYIEAILDDLISHDLDETTKYDRKERILNTISNDYTFDNNSKDWWQKYGESKGMYKGVIIGGVAVISGFIFGELLRSK